MRDFAVFLADQRGKQDWALTDVHDVEAFLVTVPKSWIAPGILEALIPGRI